MIKTMSKNELNIMLELIPEYSNHFIRNPESLLAKILGLFTIKSSQTGPVHIMLMENTLRYKDEK